jgi:ligand-binding sensor domain-containing protein
MCSGQSTFRDANLTMTVSNFTVTVGDTVKELGDSLMIIFQDSKNNYWFGSYGEGVYRFDGKTIIQYATLHGLRNDSIWQIQEDKFGNLYFNTRKGISKFDGQTFTSLIQVNSHAPDRGWELHPDDLWFTGAQDSGVVYRYDVITGGQSLYRLEFPKTQLGEEFLSKYPRSQYPNMNFNPYDVYSIYKDSKGNIWFGSGLLGVCRYNGKSVDWIHEEDVTELHDGPSNGVRSIIEDKDGYFWFSNTYYRYYVYEDGQRMKYRREKGTGDLEGYMSVARDKKDNLWIVTHGDGVWRYDGKTMTHYPIREGNKTVTLFSIYKDRQGDLWLGTHENGVYKFNGKTFERFRP